MFGSNKERLFRFNFCFLFLDELYNQLYSAREKILYLETERDMLTDRVSTLNERVEYWRSECRKIQRCGYYGACSHKKKLLKLQKKHAKCSSRPVFLYR